MIQGLLSRPNFNVQVIFPTDPVALSFTIANLLPIDNREKQRLLETTDTLERFASLIPILDKQLLEVGEIREKYEQSGQQRLWRVRPADLQEWINNN